MPRRPTQMIYAPNNGTFAALGTESAISVPNNLRIASHETAGFGPEIRPAGLEPMPAHACMMPAATNAHAQQRTTEEVIERITPVSPLLFSSLASWLLWAQRKIYKFCRNRLFAEER